MSDHDADNDLNRAFPDDEDPDNSLEALFADQENPDESATSSGERPKRDISLFNQIPVRLSLEVDTVQVTLGELLDLEPGEVLALNKKAGAPLDVKVNGQTLASAEVVVVDGHYGLRLLDIADKFKASGNQ